MASLTVLSCRSALAKGQTRSGAFIQCCDELFRIAPENQFLIVLVHIYHFWNIASPGFIVGREAANGEDRLPQNEQIGQHVVAQFAWSQHVALVEPVLPAFPWSLVESCFGGRTLPSVPKLSRRV